MILQIQNLFADRKFISLVLFFGGFFHKNTIVDAEKAFISYWKNSFYSTYQLHSARVGTAT